MIFCLAWYFAAKMGHLAFPTVKALSTNLTWPAQVSNLFIF